MQELPWPLILGLAATGVPMALASSLIGMRQWVEIPAWWVLYAIWVTVVLTTGVEAPFRTVLIASALAGTLHATTQSLLLDRYIRSNPWYADRMQGPRARLRAQFLISGVLIGTGFGALIGGIAWALRRWVFPA
jgi:hypothetical protein